MVSDFLIYAVCFAGIAGVLLRPRGSAEWMWAAGAAFALVLTRSVTLPEAGRAIARGTDVYLFLSGMMLLAELARCEGVFDWIAALAVRAARGSSWRLFAIVYGVGIVVTTVLSNDATAVVLTPAVAAAVRKARVDPVPHLFACAFVANAASFVLPISNPANLVIFAAAIPHLGRWLAAFALPSLCAIGLTFAALACISRASLRSRFAAGEERPQLSRTGAIAFAGIGSTAAVLTVASALGAPLGLATLATALCLFAVVAFSDRSAAREVMTSVPWSVLVLVAGLFVLVQGLFDTGILAAARGATEAALRLPLPFALLAGSGCVALVSNLANNLPAGLVAGTAVASLRNHEAFRSAIAIGIDLGPNLSVTGSLATILWLLALRRADVEIDAWRFLRSGLVVMPPALVAATLALLVTAR